MRAGSSTISEEKWHSWIYTTEQPPASACGGGIETETGQPRTFYRNSGEERLSQAVEGGRHVYEAKLARIQWLTKCEEWGTSCLCRTQSWVVSFPYCNSLNKISPAFLTRVWWKGVVLYHRRATQMSRVGEEREDGRTGASDVGCTGQWDPWEKPHSRSRCLGGRGRSEGSRNRPGNMWGARSSFFKS